MSEIFKKLALLGDVWVLWVLMGASVFSLAVVVERWLSFKKNKIDFPRFMKTMVECLDSHDLAKAKQTARTIPSVESRVALAGLENLPKGAASVEEGMMSQLVLERSRLEKNLIVLGTLGNNAPFIGLFGTVLGIIKAFHDLSLSGSSGVSVVMTGISSALIATAFGILVAIPSVVANNYFQTQLRRISSNAQSLIHMMQAYLKDERHKSLGARAASEPVLR